MKARVGLDICQLDRGETMCQYTILTDQVLEVPDLSADERFRHISYVAGSPYFRYYAGVPLVTRKGYNIGALCIMDHQVRYIQEDDAAMLLSFARSIVSQRIPPRRPPQLALHTPIMSTTEKKSKENQLNRTSHKL